jgi:hypothetical protein
MSHFVPEALFHCSHSLSQCRPSFSLSGCDAPLILPSRALVASCRCHIACSVPLEKATQRTPWHANHPTASLFAILSGTPCERLQKPAYSVLLSRHRMRDEAADSQSLLDLCDVTPWCRRTTMALSELNYAEWGPSVTDSSGPGCLCGGSRPLFRSDSHTSAARCHKTTGKMRRRRTAPRLVLRSLHDCRRIERPV